jgi:hypothetical protein
MKWLRKQRDQNPAPAAEDEVVCQHVVLVPMWDNAADVGREASVSGYRCETCGITMSRRDADDWRATEAERVKQRVSA